MSPKYRCKAPGCDHYESFGSKQFPTEPKIITLWLEALKLDSFKPSWRICYKHFTENDFEKLKSFDGSIKKRLKSDAVPYLQSPVVSVALKKGHSIFLTIYSAIF